ncbi:phosphate acetyltransferase [Erysipelotrichaceae bacterium]|nr:phosphate acetyltransferase [Erysipelotrichaceae bacterium]
MNLIETMKIEIKGKKLRLVLPEGWDSRVLTAAARLLSEDLAHPILLGDKMTIIQTAKGLGVNLEGMEIIDPKMYEQFDEMVKEFVNVRKGKVEIGEAAIMLQQTNYFGTMLIKMGLADALVGGVIYSTADTVRPALQIIKTKADVAKVSSMFYLHKGGDSYIFGDCAINVSPTAIDLADIATGCALAAPKFGIHEPKVAFLSFSSKGSGLGPEVDKVREATAIFQKNNPDIISDGELQFDSAVIPSVAIQKAPTSNVAGYANVLIFPDLEAANIGYKIAQRFGGYEALGPILLGLNSPINDLSRGASVEDIYKVSIITVAQVRQI